MLIPVIDIPSEVEDFDGTVTITSSADGCEFEFADTRRVTVTPLPEKKERMNRFPRASILKSVRESALTFCALLGVACLAFILIWMACNV